MKLNFTIILLLLFKITFAQVGLIVFDAEKLNKHIQKTKKHKLTEKYSAKRKFENDSILVLRVPKDKIKSKAYYYINEVQDNLDTAYNCTLRNWHINIRNLQQLIYNLKINDKDWPSLAYESELTYYEQYEHQLYDKEKKAKQYESERRKFVSDSLDSVETRKYQRIKDSLIIVESKLGAKVHIKKEEKVTKETIPASNTNSTTMHSKPAKKEPGADNFRGSSGNYHYIRGPKGGCYYINSNGIKVYVDHSYCN